VPGEEVVLMPVIGGDLGAGFSGLKQTFLFSGLLLFGAALFMESVSRKFYN
jgi:hypothetical protein